MLQVGSFSEIKTKYDENVYTFTYFCYNILHN